MAGTTTLLGLVTPTQGDLSGTWGDTVNYGITDYVDIAIAGTLSFANDGPITLINTTGSSSGNGFNTTTAQYMVIRITGTQTVAKVITGPSYSKLYMVDHAGATSAVEFKRAGQTTPVTIAVGEKAFVYYNGTDYVKVASSAGGITYGAVKTTTYTAVANEGVQTNTTGGAFTVNLPATPATGTQVFIVDSFGTWATNNLTIGRNGSTIEGSGTDLVCDINGVSIQCIYNGTTWDIYAQVGANDTAVVTLNGTQTLTNKTLTSPTITGTGAIAAATVTLSSTLGVTGVSTLTAGAVIQGLTVGRGASAVSTNTAVGVSALGAITTAGISTSVGYQSGFSATDEGYNTFVGYQAGYSTTKGFNQFFGMESGKNVTTGYSNTILGAFTGNAGGLDIRTANNYVVLSDGDGNPLISTANSQTVALKGAVPNSGTGITFPADATANPSANANTLDDYEEGTWSPGITSSSGTLTAHTSTGTYTKIGRTVTVTFSSTITTPGSASGTMNISAFPFTNGNAYQVPTVCREQANVGTAYQAVLSNSATTGFVRSFTEGSISWTAGNQYVFFMTYVV